MKELNLSSQMAELSWRTSDKLCPMKMAAGKEEACDGYRCAWWNPYYGACCVGSDYQTLDYIGRAIVTLAQEVATQKNAE